VIYDWYSDRRDDIHGYRGLTKLGRESEFNSLELEFVTDLAKLDQEVKNERARARRVNTSPSWIGFLRERSGSGDPAARSALQKQEQRFRAAMEAHLKGTGSTDAEVQEQIVKELKPEPRPKGKTAYRIDCDGHVLAYSGDTEWVETLIEAGRDADLLIVEAYFFDKQVPLHLDYKTLAATCHASARSACCNRRQELRNGSAAQLLEAVMAVSPLPCRFRLPDLIGIGSQECLGLFLKLVSD
jgi:ribonuclease BN (tRNA processing enzyme)